MTLKQRTIDACKEIAHKYRHPKDHEIGCTDSCALCNIYYSKENVSSFLTCNGCPLSTSDPNLEMGCINFESYKKAIASARFRKKEVENFEVSSWIYAYKTPTPEMRARARFHDMLIKKLERLDEIEFEKGIINKERLGLSYDQ